MLLWVDGFDVYGTSGAPTPSGVLARKYGDSSNDGTAVAAGRFGAYSLLFNGYLGNYIKTSSLTNDSTMIVGFAINFNNFSSYGGNQFISLWDGTTLGVYLSIATSGRIDLYRGSDNTLLGTTAGFELVVGSWNYVELKIVCNTSGSFTIHINGSVALSGSGNTKSGSNNYHTAFRFDGVGGSGFLVDDLYCCDSTGSKNNNFLGIQKVQTLFPNATGDFNAWAGSTGVSHYTLVNENPVDDDSTYIESNTTSQEELWNYTDPVNTGTIAGVQVCTDCRITDASTYTLLTQIKNGGVDSSDTGHIIGSSSYLTNRRVAENNPRTSGAWNQTDLTDTQFGVKVG